MEAIETTALGQYTAFIYCDDNGGDNPRDWDNAGRLICWHNRYTLGDDHSYADSDAFWADLVADHLTNNASARPVALALIRSDKYAREDYRDNYNAGAYADLVADYMEQSPTRETAQAAVNALENAGLVILPVYAYEHGQITISCGAFSCPWDSGQVGYIYATPEVITREFGGDADKARQCLEGEVSTMAQYLEGDIYGYQIEDADGCGVDSCWGFYGLDCIRQEVASILESLAADASMYQGSGI